MKASDICVGDWVNYKSPSSGKLRPIRIKNIYGAEFNCEVEDWNIISGKSISDTEPIKLTEDILAKNGFKSTQGLDFYWLDDKKHCCVKNYDGKRLFCYKQGINDVWLVVKYVHQLQHLLRLCNVQKEIEL